MAGQVEMLLEAWDAMMRAKQQPQSSSVTEAGSVKHVAKSSAVLKRYCPVCQASPGQQCCNDDGEPLIARAFPLPYVHIERQTGPKGI